MKEDLDRKEGAVPPGIEIPGILQWKHSPQDYFKTFVPDPDHLWNFKTIYQAPGKLSDGVAEASNAIRVGISDL